MMIQLAFLVLLVQTKLIVYTQILGKQVSLSINGNSVEFKLHTGADVSVVPDFIIPKLNATLRNTRRTLTGPDGSKLKVTGVISASLKANLLESKQVRDLCCKEFENCTTW